jgi:iron complex outermembrane receptor protein
MKQKAPNFRRSALARSVLLACGATATVLTVQPVMAQDAGSQLQRIEVTGSRIKRADAEGAVPITVITRENLETSGAVTVAEFIRNSTFSSAGNVRPQSGNTNQSLSTVNLRGLGSTRTLVLVDGRRVAKAATAGDTVDMNSIPMAAVERIEILTDGASAIYGSDAIGGVINIILRKDFEGAYISFGNGKPNINGGQTEASSVLVGSRGDKGSMMVGASHTSREVIFVRDAPYPYVKGASSFSNNYFKNVGTPQAPAQGSFVSAVPDGCTNPNFYTTSRCRFDFNSVAGDEAALSTDSFFGRGEVKISDDWSAYINSSVSRSQSFGRYAPVPANLFIAKGSAGDILTKTGQGNLVPDTGLVLAHRFAAGGNRDTSTDNNLYDVALGMKGRVASIDTEVGIRHTTSKFVETGRGFVVRSLAEAAINNGLYNIKDPISTPADVIKSFTTNTGRDASFTQSEIYGNAQTDLFKMGGGNAILFVSAESRKETYYDIYDSLSEAGVVEGSSGNSAGGDRTVMEIGAEMVFPFSKQLEGSLAGRYVKYSDYGSDFSPKASLRYQPMKTLTLRASVGKGFAAPSLPQLTQKASFSADTVVDLRHCQWDDPKNSVEFCKTEGFQINGLVISNSQLKSEKSTQYSFGGAWDVTPLLTVKADYWSTKIDGVISNISSQSIVNRNNGTNPLPIPAGLSINRAANGQIIQIVRGATNEGELETKGLDLSASFGSYSLAGFGKVSHDLKWSRLLGYASNGNDVVGTYGLPKDRMQLATTWKMGDFEAAWNLNVIGENGSSEDDFYNAPYVTHDVQFSYHPSFVKGAKLVVGMVNAAGKLPELDGGLSGKPFNYDLYDMYGKQVYIRGEMKF